MATYSKNPIELATSKVLANRTEDILPILDTYGVAVIALNTIEKSSLSKAIETTKFYNTNQCNINYKIRTRRNIKLYNYPI